MKELHSFQELEKIIAGSKVVALYFYNDSCQPCRVLRPKFEFLIGEKFPEIELYFIDQVKNPDISASYQIFSSPVILIYFERKEYIRKSKYVSVYELEKEIEKYYKLLFD